MFKSQDSDATAMAIHLKGLDSHYGQMQAALQDKEDGVEINEDDMTGMIFAAFISTCAFVNISISHDAGH